MTVSGEAKRKFTVGQTLFFVGAHRYNSGVTKATIEKIGRKWLTMSNGHRADVETLAADGGNYVSPGQFWPSMKEYEAADRRAASWNELYRLVSSTYHAPKHLTAEAINKIRSELLGATS